jgi:hypothetical protein
MVWKGNGFGLSLDIIGIWLEGLRNRTKSQDSRPPDPDQDLNPEPLALEAGMPTVEIMFGTFVFLPCLMSKRRV